MNSILKKAGLGVALAATAITAAAPAEAQRYRGDRYYHRGNGNGTAVVAGIAGLAIGAAIASNSNRGRYYDRGYYNDGYYNRGYNGYYDRGYNGYYDRGYYPPRGDYYRECRIERRWDPYYERPVRVRVCY